MTPQEIEEFKERHKHDPGIEGGTHTDVEKCPVCLRTEIVRLRAEVERLMRLSQDLEAHLDADYIHVDRFHKLERERDEALEGQELLQRAFDETHQQVAKERDEALKRVEVYREDGERLIRERDEALSQVANLLNDYGVEHPEDEEDGCGFCQLRMSSSAAKARALLDRLQRAEAVVKSQWEHRCSDGVGGCTAVSAEALAAWEEGKA